MDTDSFSECLSSGQYTQIVQTQTSSAQQIGVQSTPTFLVNGQPIVGAQGYDVFQQVIDGLLNE